MYPLLFHFGHIAIPTYGVFTALALLAALAVAVRGAKRAGLPSDKVWTLGLIAILAALFGARLLLVAAHLQAFRMHPFWVLGLASLPGTWIALGGVAIGLAAGALYAMAEDLPLLRTADVTAPAVALAFGLNRIGAFCAGLAWGKPTQMPWGVTYRNLIAYLWYRTPLGVRVQPVQLYDAAVSLAIFALLLAMPRRRDGEAAGAWLFLYGLGRFFVEFFRGDLAHAAFASLSLAQVLSVVAVLAGGALWLHREPAQRAATAAS